MDKMTLEIAIHCMKTMICREVCEECPYYGTTGTDHCEDDAIIKAIAALEMQEKLKERIAGLVAKRKVNPWEEMFIGEVVKMLEEFVI